MPGEAAEAYGGMASLAEAKKAGVAHVLDAEATSFEHLGKAITIVHGLAADGVTPLKVAVDDQGAVVDVDDLIRQDDEARYALVGALHAGLRALGRLRPRLVRRPDWGGQRLLGELHVECLVKQ